MSTYTKLDSYKSTCCNALLWKMQKAQWPTCSDCGKPHNIGFPSAAKRRNHSILMGIKEVENRMGKVSFPGELGTYEIVQTLNRELKHATEGLGPDERYGLQGTSILRLKRAKE